MNEKARPTLTFEALLYGLIFVAALALRFLHLGAHPLNDLEAREALIVLGHLRGAGDAALGPQSPAYFFFTFISFLLFGASDATARAGPALAGALLTLVPALYRQRLGRGPALAAAALLAIASSLLAASRSADGVIFALLGLSAAVGALLRYREGGSTYWLFIGAAALGLGLAGGGSFWLGAVALALTILGLRWLEPEARDDMAELGASVRPQGRALLITVALSALLIATVFFTFIRGMGALVDSTVGWLSSFSPASAGRAPLILLVFLAAYEPLIVIFGILGAVRAFRRRWLFGQGLAWFGLVALILLLLTSGRRLPDILWVTVPLAVLAGKELFESFAAAVESANWPLAAAQAGVTLVLAVFALLNVASYAEVVKN
ncbi:MAG: glycosyltransferase family 39 protein, partial [Anaerolineales bacterium]